MRFPALLLVTVMACEPGPSLTGTPPGFPHAYAHRTCAPWDGAAVAVYLTPAPLDTNAPLPPATTYIGITIWRGVERLPDMVWTWPTSEQIGSVTRCPAQGDCEQATAASVRFRSADSTASLEGDLEATFPSGASTMGGFHATWRSEQVFCG